MRTAFFQTLTELAEKDKRIILIVCDVGFSFLDDYTRKFPNQFLNAGVTEQSATGIAAGLALSGWKPYLYTMIPFVCMRNYEQVRNDICHTNANVKLIGVRGSVHYRFLGKSHNITENEDMRILGHLPNIKLFIPDKPEQIRPIMLDTYEKQIPVYLRL